MLDLIDRIVRIFGFVICLIYFAQAGLCVRAAYGWGEHPHPYWWFLLGLALALATAGSFLLRQVLRGPHIRDASPSPAIGNTLPTFSALGAVRYGIAAALIIESFIFRDAHYEDHPKDLLTAWTPCLLIFGALAFMSDSSWAIIKAPPVAIGRALRSWLRQ